MTWSEQQPASQCMAVVHIPKTGGSALRTSFAQIDGAYAGSLYFDTEQFGSPDWIDDITSNIRQTIVTDQLQLADVARHHRLVIGHFSLGNMIAAGCTDVAFQVREPRARLLSLYRFWQSQSASVYERWGAWGAAIACASLPLGAFLRQSAPGPAVDNAMARQLLVSERNGTGDRRRALVNETCTLLLRMDAIVEWSSSSQRFAERVCGALGTPTSPALERVNVTEVRDGEQVLDAGTLAQLAEMTATDRLLVDRLAEFGLLAERSAADLESEFETCARTLGFRFA